MGVKFINVVLAENISDPCFVETYYQPEYLGYDDWEKLELRQNEVFSNKELCKRSFPNHKILVARGNDIWNRKYVDKRFIKKLKETKSEEEPKS